jgi:Dynamin family
MTGPADQRYAELRREVLDLFPDALRIAGRRPAGEALRRLTAAHERLRAGRLTVVICGEFKRGKSSLINALLGQDDLLPVDDYYATSLITRIRYGPRPRIVVRLAGDADPPGPDREQEISRAELAGFVTQDGNPGNEKGVLAVTVELPSEPLATGLELVDTPGIGGVYAAHTQATQAILPGADAIVFVNDGEPLKDSELRFLRDAAETARVIGDEDALLFAMTKIDLYGDYASRLDNMRGKIATVTSRPAASVIVVPVSSQVRLDALRDRDPALDRLSNFAELEAMVWAALTRRQATVILGGALTDLELSAVALLRPIEDESAALRARTRDAMEELQAALENRRGRLDQLAVGDATWRQDVAADVAGIAEAAGQYALTLVDGIWATLRDDYFRHRDLLDDPDKLVGQLNEDIGRVLGVLNEQLASRIAQLQREFAARHGLDIDRTRIDGLPPPPVWTLPAEPAAARPAPPPADPASSRPGLRTVTDLAQRGRAALGPAPGLKVGSTAGMAAGRLVGAFLIPGVGTIVVGAVGGAAGAAIGGGYDAYMAIKTEHERREARRRYLQTRLQPAYQELRDHVSASLGAVTAAFTRDITAELDSRIRQERDSVEESARRARESSQRGETQARARQAELDAERAPLDELRARVAAALAAATALGARPAASPGPVSPGPADGGPADGDEAGTARP